MDSSEDQARRGRRQRLIGGIATAALGAAAAVISYGDGLFLVRLARITGHVVYLYPLLPDGLIAVSTASLYEAALTGAGRPRWATAGVVTGAALTVAMNVAAGTARGWVAALADAAVPVVFFVALEILVGLIRRGRDGGRAPLVPATQIQCPHAAATTADELVVLAHEHARDCLGKALSQRQLAAITVPSRARVAELVGATPQTRPGRSVEVPRPGRPRPPAPEAAPTGAGANGSQK